MVVSLSRVQETQQVSKMQAYVRFTTSRKLYGIEAFSHASTDLILFCSQARDPKKTRYASTGGDSAVELVMAVKKWAKEAQVTKPALECSKRRQRLRGLSSRVRVDRLETCSCRQIGGPHCRIPKKEDKIVDRRGTTEISKRKQNTQLFGRV